MINTRILRFAAALVLTSMLGSPAFAANKDMIQLQTQMQQLQDAVARLQQSNDERMGVLKDLVQQSADSVNRLATNVDTLQKQLAAQQTAQGGKADQVSGQIQSLNDSVDEVKARMIKLEKVLNDVQGRQESISASLQNMPQSGAPAGLPASAPSSQPSNYSSPSPAPSSAPVAPPSSGPRGKPSAAIPDSSAIPGGGGPSVNELYRSAYGDYMAAKYSVAASEFGDVIKAYPNDSLAGNSYYYLGEMDYRAARYSEAAKNYDKVLEQFPDNNKIPASYLHKGQALIAMKQSDAGVRELRALIQRYPSSPEAAQARSKLNGMGIPVRPKA
jgi:tol-pal system protein YbgF